MPSKALLIPIDEKLHKKFKIKCSEEEIFMKDAVIALIKGWVEGKIKLKR